jgi:hypothetical protein
MLPTKFRFIWPSGFRGEDLKKSAIQKQELPVVAMFVNGSGQNVQSLERTFYRCCIPSFSSFGWGVSEEKIKMWKVNGRRMPSDGKSSHCLKIWRGELKIQYVHPRYTTKIGPSYILVISQGGNVIREIQMYLHINYMYMIFFNLDFEIWWR